MARRKQPPAAAESLEVIPERFRRFKPAEWPGYDSSIAAFYAWREARAAWEAESGIHIQRSWERARDRSRAGARTLAEHNEPYDAAHFVEPDEDDPRRDEPPPILTPEQADARRQRGADEVLREWRDEEGSR